MCRIKNVFLTKFTHIILYISRDFSLNWEQNSPKNLKKIVHNFLSKFVHWNKYCNAGKLIRRFSSRQQRGELGCKATDVLTVKCSICSETQEEASTNGVNGFTTKNLWNTDWRIRMAWRLSKMGGHSKVTVDSFRGNIFRSLTCCEQGDWAGDWSRTNAGGIYEDSSNI